MQDKRQRIPYENADIILLNFVIADVITTSGNEALGGNDDTLDDGGWT